MCSIIKNGARSFRFSFDRIILFILSDSTSLFLCITFVTFVHFCKRGTTKKYGGWMRVLGHFCKLVRFYMSPLFSTPLYESNTYFKLYIYINNIYNLLLYLVCILLYKIDLLLYTLVRNF